MIYDNIRQLVGNTPTVFYKEINSNRLYLKLEMFNPAGSVKDRIALSMVDDLINRGILTKDTTVIEATSGNTGIGLAFILASLNIPLILTMPDNMTKERISLLKAYGAKVILTLAKERMTGAKLKAEQLSKEYGYLYLDQFTNKANPIAHMKTTAEEIIRDFKHLDYLVLGVGTGGSINGLFTLLTKHYPNLKIIAVEPAESAVLSGEKAGSHEIPGIGAGFIPPFFEAKMAHQIIKVTSQNAKDKTRKLAREGLFFGVSSGAAIYASEQIANKKKGKTILAIACDGGIKYLSLGIYE
jgi:cysteine synthase